VLVKNLTNAIAVTTGSMHTCALIADGTVRCWGRNDQGQTGLAGSSDAWEPYLVQGLSPVVAIDAGVKHTCAVLVSGGVKCWGDNLFGQLGNGTNNDSGSPVSVAALTRATSVSAGENHSCAVRADGRVKCWGLGTDGRLGQGEFASSSTPVFVTGLVEVVAVSAGTFHTCAATARGRAWCWGDNGFMKLGDGTSEFRPSPVLVKTETGFLGGVIGVGAGGAHTCALLAGGNVHCWGQNYDGQIGNGSAPYAEPSVSVPTAAQGASGTPLTGIVALAVGGSNTCAVLASGRARCWGSNAIGQLGTNQTAQELPSASTAQAVSNFSVGAKAIALSSGQLHTCALIGTGKVKCWGMNDRGQLGNGQINSIAPLGNATPGEVVAVSGAVALDSGGDLSCAVLSNGRVKCWGAAKATPYEVPGLRGVVHLAVHSNHSCAVTAAGGVRCWGKDDVGQLGNGPGLPVDANTPVEVVSLGAVTNAAVGPDDSCAVRASGALLCWGLGMDPNNTIPNNAPVSMAQGVTTVALANFHGCALPGSSQNALGDRRCWGFNEDGEFGNGGKVSSGVPVRIPGPPEVTGLALSRTNGCARLANGGAKCWGNDSLGQLGDGPPPTEQYFMSADPVTVKSLNSSAVAVTAGDGFACALLANGGAKCWGEEANGVLGNPVTTNAQTPIAVLGL
jgi:alpha-tubulin suppressor-like RCC1 family protein